LLGRTREHRGPPQLPQGLVRLMEPGGKSRAEPRRGRVKNYEQMSESHGAKQMSRAEIISAPESRVAPTKATSASKIQIA
jgi:hypothetical protein